ncbi:brachyurin-like [Chironomus tepperi]|uniref:brachyurin-like n=1 Tax=Chironomus tepperi TaxID=113505 RepID=UPI00391FB6D0
MSRNFNCQSLQCLKMKLLISLIFWILLVSTVKAKELPEDWKPFDFSQIIPIEEVVDLFSSLPKEAHQDSRNRRIFGGQEVVPNSHPYQVAYFIQVNPQRTSICGGSILNSQAILTAAHCIYRFPRVTVVAGGHNIHRLEPTQQRRSSEFENFRVHPGWSGLTFSDDIGIVLLPTALEFNTYVVPARLPIGLENETFAGELSRVVGWGITGLESGTNPVLHAAYNTVMSNEDCIAIWGEELVLPTIVCTSTNRQGACSSDSGGSLTVPRPGDTRPVQIGIVNWGSICGSSRPVGFARITEYLEWISDNDHFDVLGH